MVILFDGVCNLCNGFVQFVLKRDKNKTFQFASIQSKYGKQLSSYFNLPTNNYETLVLYDGQNTFTESDAVYKILSSLGGIWNALTIFRLMPRSISNWIYRLVARNRYKIFGKKDQCMVPDWNVKDRFIDNTSFTLN